MRPLLEREHRVVAIDLLGYGGSEKPGSRLLDGDQAELVAEALEARGQRREVVGHSLGGAVARPWPRAPQLVDRVVIVDMAPDTRRWASASSPGSPSRR